MSVAELYHGRGAPMSLHELNVMWPAYFRQRAEDMKLAAMQADD